MSTPTTTTTPPSSLETSLARAQLATPLSLLILIAAALLSSLLAHPSLPEISNDYLTILTPNSTFIGAYWGLIALLLIGQTMLLVAARKVETKQLLTSGVGIRQSLVLLLMALWTLFWTLRFFLVSEIILFVTLAVAASIWGTTLLYDEVETRGKRPLDYLFVHVPTRMILCVLFSVDIWQNGLLALGWYRYLGSEPGQHHGHWETDHGVHSWIAFGVIFGVALINAGIVFAFQDFAWAASAIYISIAIAIKGDAKPPQVIVTTILGGALVLVALLSSIGWSLLKHDQEGAIRLAEEEEEEDEAAVAAAQAARDPVGAAAPV